MIFVFTLGNSTDAFLLLRAKQLGVPVALAPILWALLNGVKSRVEHAGRRAVGSHRPASDAHRRMDSSTRSIYFLFARATQAWHAWALFAGLRHVSSG